MKQLKLAILGSTRGTILEPIIQAMIKQQIPANIEAVISDRPTAPILKRAQNYNIPAHVISLQGVTRSAFDSALTELLERYDVDLIVLIGYMRILSKEFVDHWQQKIVNVHPSLLPDFGGLMDLKVHQAVLDAKRKTTGCTVHYVTHDVDAGPILTQKSCPVLMTDTAETLKMRVQKLESDAILDAIRNIAENKFIEEENK